MWMKNVACHILTMHAEVVQDGEKQDIGHR